MGFVAPPGSQETEQEEEGACCAVAAGKRPGWDGTDHEAAERGGSAAGAKPGFSRGAAVSDPRVELGLFEHHHCAVSGQWPGGS